MLCPWCLLSETEESYQWIALLLALLWLASTAWCAPAGCRNITEFVRAANKSRSVLHMRSRHMKNLFWQRKDLATFLHTESLIMLSTHTYIHAEADQSSRSHL